jgi:RepB DNA-primase N-terminal domain
VTAGAEDIGGEGRLVPYRKEASRFLAALDPDAVAFSFQTLDDDKARRDPALSVQLHGSLDQHWDELCRLNGAGAGVYVTINTPDRVRAAFLDSGGNPLQLEFRFRPSVVVEAAPGRLNWYWLLDCPLERFAELQRALLENYNRDAADVDLARVMRLPGFFSRTRMGKFRVRLVEVHHVES